MRGRLLNEPAMKRRYSLRSLLIGPLLLSYLVYLNVCGQFGNAPNMEPIGESVPSGVLYGWPFFVGVFKIIHFPYLHEAKRPLNARTYVVVAELREELRGTWRIWAIAANAAVCLLIAAILTVVIVRLLSILARRVRK